MRYCCCLMLLTLASAAHGQWKVSPGTMMTRWGKQVTPQNAWQEYPRPQFRREENWKNLNGLWQYGINQKSQIPIAARPLLLSCETLSCETLFPAEMKWR